MITIEELESLQKKLFDFSKTLSLEERTARNITTTNQVKAHTLATLFMLKYNIFLNERKTNECKF